MKSWDQAATFGIEVLKFVSWGGTINSCTRLGDESFCIGIYVKEKSGHVVRGVGRCGRGGVRWFRLSGRTGQLCKKNMRM